MEFVLALAIIGLFALEMTHREKTKRLTQELLALTSRVNALSSEWTLTRHAVGIGAAESSVAAQPVRARRRVRAGAHAVPAESPRRAQPLAELDQAVLAETVPEVAATSVAVALGLDQQKQVSPIGQWLRRFFASDEWEALIGGRLLNRIGAIALILGMGLFFKYAVDQNWIDQSARVAIGVVVGAGLLALAHRSHRRGYAVFAQGLVGAGQAVLYLSVFASYNFYHLVPQPVALVGMGAVTALGFGEALYYDSLVVSLLACLGGYLTPFLLHASGSEPLGTVAYLLLLNVEVLAVFGRRPRWTVLEPIALGATYAAYFTWYLTDYRANQMLLAVIALSLFWALFLGHELRTLLAGQEDPRELWHSLGVVNGLAYIVGLYALLGQAHPVWMAGLTLAVSAVHAGLLLITVRRGRLSAATEVRYGLSAIVLLVFATAIPLRGFPVAVLWTVEALALLWAGIHWGRRYLWQPALGIYVLALGLLFATSGALAYGVIEDYRPVINLRDLAYLVLIGAFVAGAMPVRRLPGRVGEALWRSFQYAWIGLSLVFLTVETTDIFRRLMVGATGATRTGLHYDQLLTVALVWMAFSLALGTLGWRRQVAPWVLSSLAAAGLAVALMMVAGSTYQPIGVFVPVLNVRVLAFVLVACGLALHLRWLARQEKHVPWAGSVRSTIQLAILTIGFELLTAEINDFFMRRSGHTLLQMDDGGVFIELAVLSALWALYSLLPTWLGVRVRTMPLVALGLTMAAAATAAAAFGVIVLQPSHQLSLALWVRPLVLVVLVSGLLAQLRWIRATAPVRRWRGRVLVGLQVAVILLGFGLVSAETRDAFAQMIAGASAQRASTLQNLERLAYSLIWLAYAIGVMVLGIWRRARWMRLGAMALLGTVILKVFIYDLSFLGTVYRPVSFAGLGVVLLVVSFLYQKYRRLLVEP